MCNPVYLAVMCIVYAATYIASDTHRWQPLSVFQAFEHLLDRELINYAERFTTVEYTPVKLLISSQELKDGLHSNSVCPVNLSPTSDEVLFPSWLYVIC